MKTFSVFMERYELPQSGDKIEFKNDRYTDKGPATGTVVNCGDDTIMVMFDEKVIISTKEFEFKKLGDDWVVE